MINKQFPNSSAIEKADYDESTQRLTIKFSGGKSYDYDDVPPNIIEELANADSPGRFVAQTLKGKYPSRDQPQPVEPGARIQTPPPEPGPVPPTNPMRHANDARSLE